MLSSFPPPSTQLLIGLDCDDRRLRPPPPGAMSTDSESAPMIRTPSSASAFGSLAHGDHSSQEFKLIPSTVNISRTSENITAQRHQCHSAPSLFDHAHSLQVASPYDASLYDNLNKVHRYDSGMNDIRHIGASSLYSGGMSIHRSCVPIERSEPVGLDLLDHPRSVASASATLPLSRKISPIKHKIIDYEKASIQKIEKRKSGKRYSEQANRATKSAKTVCDHGGSYTLFCSFRSDTTGHPRSAPKCVISPEFREAFKQWGIADLDSFFWDVALQHCNGRSSERSATSSEHHIYSYDGSEERSSIPEQNQDLYIIG